MLEKLEYSIKIAGHILDKKIPQQIYQRNSQLIENDIIDIKNVKIYYPSCKAFKKEGGYSIMDFFVVGEKKHIEDAVRIIKNISEENKCRIIYMERMQDIARYHIQIAGHIIERDIMKKVSQIFMGKNIDLENVKIKYPSMKAFEDEESPSILDFYLVGSEREVDDAIESLENLVIENNCRLIFITRTETERCKHYVILVHVIEDNLMDELANLFSDCPEVDIINIEIKYGSMKECAEKRGPALLEIELVGPEQVMVQSENMLETFIEGKGLRKKDERRCGNYAKG